MLRFHQEKYFISGLKKLGLDAEDSDAVRCAKYHCISNAIGGLRTRYAVESKDKAWVFYYPHTCEHTAPTVGQAIHTRENMIVDYRGWHANNGELLGNHGLIFVATHFMADGDPFDAGYFFDTGVFVPPGERSCVQAGERIPLTLKFQPPAVDPALWPEDRRSKAMRHYAVTWAADRIWTVVHEFGDEGMQPVAHGLGLVVYQWLPRLVDAFVDLQSDSPGLEQFLRVFEGIQAMAGCVPEVRRTEGGAMLTCRRSIHDFVAGDVSSVDASRIDAALRQAWTKIADHFDPKIRLVTGTRGNWQFSTNGA
jgi:hypothetical protein